MKLVCDNCGKTFGGEGELEHRLPDIPRLGNRLDPGGTVPAGTCPACGCLVYPRTCSTEAAGSGEQPGGAQEAPDREFFVEWTIDVSATGFRQAAQQALRIQRRGDSIATVFDVTCSNTGVRRTVDLSEDSSSDKLRCRICGNRVGATRLRAHLCHHNPNADNMDWESVRDTFEIEDPDSPEEAECEERVVVVVRGGVAEVVSCPDGVIVEVRDYDTDGCDQARLSEDGSMVAVVEGPVPDWIDDFAVGAAEELADDGFTEAEARAIASKAAAIIREHETRESDRKEAAR